MKSKKKSYTIHKSKKSQSDKNLSAGDNLRRNLERTTYRVDSVKTLNGIEFICDTRSTDLLSTRDTFKYIEKPIVWISGKPLHERDYSLLENYLTHKIKAIVVYGGPSEDMQQKLGSFIESFDSKITLADTVKAAYEVAKEGDAVVYSPSCAVKDDYLNYVDRGKDFLRIIETLN